MKSKIDTYQMVLVFQPKLPSKEREAVMEKITAMLKKSEAVIEKQEDMGTKELAYDIKKQSRGDFWKMDIKVSGSLRLNEINLFLNREAQVIRYLVLKN